MKQKKNETVPVLLVVLLLLLCTAAAGGLALLAKSDFILSFPVLNFGGKTAAPAAAEVEAGTAEEEAEDVYVDEELHKIANMYGEIFGLLVNEGVGSLTEDRYCADELYQVEYPAGQVQLNTVTKELYWFCRNNVKTDELRLTEKQLVTKAKEYFSILQLEKDYGHIARKVDRDSNIATVIFQRVIDVEAELYSDYEAVKMVLSAQTGELMSCKIFTLPLVEQEGKRLNETQAIAAVQDALSAVFQSKAEAELTVCSPIIWGDEDNYTSRVVWKVTADNVQYFVDAYSGSVLGTQELEA